MNSSFRKLAVESLEGRSVLSTLVEADFNSDGYQDVAAITGPNTITVSLFDPVDGGYEVSAILKTPKGQSVQNVGAYDVDNDGDLDIVASNPKGSAWEIYTWTGDGDGTFGSFTKERWKVPKNWF
jgi:hypothetical protein